LDLRTYIESGAVECYLLGLASAEEEMLLEEMRRLYPELESEISVTAFRLEEAAMEGGVTPPAEVWDRINRRVRREAQESQQRRRTRRDEAAYTVINLQEAPPNRYMKVNIWWRCAFIALCMLVMVLLACSIYFYRKYHEMEERVLQPYPASHLSPSSTK
jgi:cbb3-type cytochrome oxidase subunit 3